MSSSPIASTAPVPQASDPEGEIVLHQVADLIKSAYQLKSTMTPAGSSFQTIPHDPPRRGVQSVRARLTDTRLIILEIELLKTEIRVRPALDELWDKLAELKEGVRPLSLESTSGKGAPSFRLELKIGAGSSLTASRHAVISRELERIDDIALWAQSEIPQSYANAELDKLYSDNSDILRPIYPLADGLAGSLVELNNWATETAEYLQAGPNIAVAVPQPTLEDICLAALARATMAGGGSLGYLDIPGVPGKLLLEAAAKSPGRIVLPVERVCMGLSPYEIAEHLHALLECLASAGTPAIFTGTHSQLQKAFHGGQGGACNPFLPLLRIAPNCPLPELIRFTVELLAQRAGGVPESAFDELTSAVGSALGRVPQTQRTGLVSIVASHQIHSWKTCKPGTAEADGTRFAIRSSEIQATLAGISKTSRIERSEALQSRLLSILEPGRLLDILKDQLLAQDSALNELVDRLRTETLTRPGYQPIRYLAEGTPGTGKSESAAILARTLGVPLVTIDAASMSDSYVASSQLLGSGRGIVGSNESGRLEKAAKSHHGVVVEISDLDHCRESVRSVLSDLFLQLLEQGHFQTSTGAVISASNMILAFTVNLPDSADERVGIPMGFNAEPTADEIQRTVEKELKKLFSTAFLSRVGQPILFSSLKGDPLAIIAERTAITSLELALSRLQITVTTVDASSGLGAALISSMNSNVTSLGARTVAEYARKSIALAISELAASNRDLNGKRLLIRPRDGHLQIDVSN